MAELDYVCAALSRILTPLPQSFNKCHVPSALYLQQHIAVSNAFWEEFVAEKMREVSNGSEQWYVMHCMGCVDSEIAP